jgi:hypothetical protein
MTAYLGATLLSGWRPYPMMSESYTCLEVLDRRTAEKLGETSPPPPANEAPAFVLTLAGDSRAGACTWGPRRARRTGCRTRRTNPARIRRRLGTEHRSRNARPTRRADWYDNEHVPLRMQQCVLSPRPSRNLSRSSRVADFPGSLKTQR